MANQNYDTNGTSKSEYEKLLRTSILDMREALDKLRLLEKFSSRQRVSGRSIEAIRICSCFTLANINLHLAPLSLRVDSHHLENFQD